MAALATAYQPSEMDRFDTARTTRMQILTFTYFYSNSVNIAFYVFYTDRYPLRPPRR